LTPARRFPVDPSGWLVVEEQFDPDRQRAQETVFSVGNGVFATRGSFEEGYPGNSPATFAHGVWAPHPLAHSELASLPDWTAMDVWLDGERFSAASGTLLSHRRELDLRNGVMRREVTWRSTAGRTTELTFERFASLARPHVAAVRVRVRPRDFDGQVEVHARLNARADIDGLAHTEWHSQPVTDSEVGLAVLIRGRGTIVGEAMRLRASDEKAKTEIWNAHEQPVLVARWSARADEEATFEKTVVIVTSRQSEDAIAEAMSELGSLSDLDFEDLLGESEDEWRKEWALADIVIEGDPEAQVAVRFSLFQLLIAGPRIDDRVSIGAKGLTGFGYRGHVFWDTDTFMVPFFIHVRPEIARNLLSYRFHTIDGARRKAAAGGFAGAQFAWESAETGDEVTPTWLPDATGSELIRVWTGDIALHITAVVARAVMDYWRATGDDAFMVERGAEIVIEGARFWASRAEWADEHARVEFRDVLGPDEYHEHVDNNAYTNHLVAWHLRAAIEVADWLRQSSPERLEALLGSESRTSEVLAELARVADAVHLDFRTREGAMEQFEGYFDLRDVDLARYEDRRDSMQYILGMHGVAETQIIKQPDVLQLAAVAPELFDREALQANYDYYGPRTDHSYGSSLGPGIQAMLAARLGRAEDAYEQFVRAARVDLADVRGNAEHGTHAASNGALWQAVVFGFAGVAFDGDEVRTEPALPPHWRRLAFRLSHRGRIVDVDLRAPERRASSRLDIVALIFDLDGVVTNTSEAHYLAWQRLANEEGLPFDRQRNEALRGISRRESLALILGARSVSADKADELMERKNHYYLDLIARLTPDDVLPGAVELIDEARRRGLKVALGSASKNAREVLDRLAIADRFDAILDGNSVQVAKPAPDLFLAAAEALGVPADQCVVFEDATDGVAAGIAAGMFTVGIGPDERVGAADVVLREGFSAVNLDAVLDLLAQRRATAAA
jgi:kojibiose phosphorylase